MACESLNASVEDTKVFVDVTKALFEDFHKYVSGDSGDVDFFRLLGAYENICRFGVGSMRELVNKSDCAELKATLEQLEKERDGYRLMARLMKAETEVAGAKDSQLNSVLSRLLCNDTEFRRLRVLLHWVEEIVLEDPQSFKQLSSDYSNFDDVPFLFSNTLNDLEDDPDMCTLDYDGRFAEGAELNENDEAQLEKVSRAILQLLKCGRYNEAKDLMDRVGFPGLIPFVVYKDFINDPALTILDKENENHGLYKARKEFKDLGRQIIKDLDSPLPHIERCILALLIGELEPLKSYSTSTSHKLFTFLNTSLETRIDAAFDESNGNDAIKSNELSIGAIFDEILMRERSPYYPIYRHITVDESERAVSYILQWVIANKDKGQLMANCHVFRFFVHLALLFKTVGSPYREVELHQIIRSFVEVLKEIDCLMLIPFYLSQLPRDEALVILVDLLYDLEESQDVRTAFLDQASKVGFEAAAVCELVYDKVLAENAKPDADDSTALKIFNIFPYLLYCRSKTSLRAVVEANNLLRMFFELERLDLGTDLFDVISSTIPDSKLDELVRDYWSGKEHEMSEQCYDNLQEFLQYRDYYETLEIFDEWAKGWAKEAPAMPEPLLRSKYEQLSVSEKNRYAGERRMMKDRIARHQNHQMELKTAVVDRLKELISLETQLFVPRQIGETTKRSDRVEKLALIRPKYIEKIYIMLIKLFVKIEDNDGLIDVGASLVDSTTQHYKVLSKEQLRSLNEMLTGEVECFVTENML